MAIRTPEFLQTKSYTALRDRLLLAHGGAIQAGVWDSGDFAVTQRGAGANMSVDVAAGYCLVPANHPSNAGLYHVQNDAVANTTVTAAHATLPRIDQICVQVTDTTDGGGASDAGTIVVLAGTPTSGATLDNRTGAASLPNGTLRLADVLVGAAVTSITTSNIRDRRPWARGAYASVTTTGPTYWTGAGSRLLNTARGRGITLECAGPVALYFDGYIKNDGAAGTWTVTVQFAVDGTTTNNRLITQSTSSTNGEVVRLGRSVVLSPGSAGRHDFDVYGIVNQGPTWGAYAYTLTAVELVAQASTENV